MHEGETETGNNVGVGEEWMGEKATPSALAECFPDSFLFFFLSSLPSSPLSPSLSPSYLPLWQVSTLD